MSSLIRILEIFGFCQKRCSACLTPYFASDLLEPEGLPTLRLCPACQRKLAAYQGPVCRICRVPHANALCEICEKERRPWNGAASHGIYAGSLRDLILRLKFTGELQIALLLAELLYEASKCLPKPDAIVAVPQSPRRLLKRGFNQAHEIGRQLSRLTGFKMAPGLLQRIKQGVPQEGLGAQERKLNLENAFRARPEAAGKTIWLLDDVLTTGSTCASASQELLNAGAKAVYVLFVARTPL